MPVFPGGGAGASPSDTTVADLITRTRQHILGHTVEELALLGSTLTASAGEQTISLLSAPVGLSTGSIISIDLEEMYVQTGISTGNSVQVMRGYNGSPVTSHDTGDVVRIKPRFSDWRIFQALNDEIDDLSTPGNGLFRVLSKQLTFSAQYQGYDLADVTDIEDILDVSFSYSTGRAWPRIDDWELRQIMPTSDFASGLALVLNQAGMDGQPIWVRYRAPFSRFSATDEYVLAQSGLHVQAHDIPPLGAAVRLVSPGEIARNNVKTQGDTRRATEVPAGAILHSPDGVARFRAQRISREAHRLDRMYPQNKRRPIRFPDLRTRWR